MHLQRSKIFFFPRKKLLTVEPEDREIQAGLEMPCDFMRSQQELKAWVMEVLLTRSTEINLSRISCEIVSISYHICFQHPWCSASLTPCAHAQGVNQVCRHGLNDWS